MRALLVDDLPENIRLLEMMLRPKGYETEAAGNGHEALEKAHLRPPDVIVSDILMPGMDGFALCRAWTRDPILGFVPFVFYTATYLSEEDEALGLSLGAVAFLRKPLDQDRLVAEVERALQTVRSGTLPSLPPSAPEEPVFLKLYNERLITKLEKRSTDLKISESRYRALFEASRDAIFLADPRTGLLLDANPAACALAGRSREQLVGQHQAGLHPPEDAERHRREFREACDPAAGRFLSESLVLHADGRRIPVEITASVFETRAGPAIMGVFRDVTERRRAEEAIQQLNAELEQRVLVRTSELEFANMELEAFSYSVSHDLRAPLRAIDGFSAVLAETCGPRLDDEGRRILGRIRAGAQRMGQLIDALLTLSRLGRQDMVCSRVEMRELARAGFEEIAGEPVARERIAFTLGELPAARGDPALLRQVWTNLLSNAVKFSAPRERPAIGVEGEIEGDTVVYRVRDDGVGFDPTHAGKMFGAFQRLHADTRFAGTGIGLAIVQRIVTRHGGRVWAEGSVGEGATFSFALPREGSPSD